MFSGGFISDDDSCAVFVSVSVTGVMTTEVGSETDVKKEPEKVPEVQQQTEPQQTEQPDKAADSAAQPASASDDQPQVELTPLICIQGSDWLFRFDCQACSFIQFQS